VRNLAFSTAMAGFLAVTSILVALCTLLRCLACNRNRTSCSAATHWSARAAVALTTFTAALLGGAMLALWQRYSHSLCNQLCSAKSGETSCLVASQNFSWDDESFAPEFSGPLLFALSTASFIVSWTVLLIRWFTAGLCSCLCSLVRRLFRQRSLRHERDDAQSAPLLIDEDIEFVLPGSNSVPMQASLNNATALNRGAEAPSAPPSAPTASAAASLVLAETGLLREEAQRLRTEAERAAHERQCPICMDRPKNMVFQCGHTLCAECAAPVAQCPICRARVTSRTRIYG
jgi:hypothetical protein